jgi:hypothetical protein
MTIVKAIKKSRNWVHKRDLSFAIKLQFNYSGIKHVYETSAKYMAQ